MNSLSLLHSRGQIPGYKLEELVKRPSKPKEQIQGNPDQGMSFFQGFVFEVMIHSCPFRSGLASCPRPLGSGR